MTAAGWFLLASIVLFSFGHWMGAIFCYALFGWAAASE